MAVIPTPTTNRNLVLRLSGFSTIAEALDYAARGETGYNFFTLRGKIEESLPYATLRDRARELAARLTARFDRGARIALVAETSPDFLVLFFACQYAGLIPAPMPMPVNLGGKNGYLVQIRQMILGANAAAAVAPASLAAFVREAADGLEGVEVYDYDALQAMAPSEGVEPFGPDDACYIQYSSGSTSAPKGVIGTQKSVTSNLFAITKHGLKLTVSDRAACWLPLYHDMGLIGFVLAPLFGQRSVDFLATSDFVRRPLLWLRLMTENKTTITYSPSFGYELAAKRAARAEAQALDLSHLRVAGIGGDMVRVEALNAFSDAFAGAGFDRRAFLPSYGLAEATLAISFTDLDEEIRVDHVDMRHYTRSGVAQPASAVTSPEHKRAFIRCGKALPDHEIEVRGENGQPLDPRVVGRIFIKGPSVTPGYFSDARASEQMFADDWLDTGDMGYFLDGQIVITGRAKDLIIINGRNIWPQDIEWTVEKVEGVRQGGVAAFSVDDGSGERVVVVAECRGMDDEARAALKREVARVVQNTAGAPAEIVLVRPHSLVMTSSGKLSRAKVKQKYLAGDFSGARAEVLADPPRALAEARV
ncbi:MAG: fatty acyl-AMP ligase [Parvularculaceae bacterium]